MLVLTRKPVESIHIGDNIKVTLLSTNEQRAKIGITAPDGIIIARSELLNGNSTFRETLVRRRAARLRAYAPQLAKVLRDALEAVSHANMDEHAATLELFLRAAENAGVLRQVLEDN